MKPWMKYALWCFICGGFGVFIGDRIGYRRAMKEKAEPIKEINSADDDEELTELYEQERKFMNALHEYAANLDKPDETASEEDPEMPMEEPVIDEEDIPQLHPEDLKPEIINEDEFNINYWHYDLENLLFYSMDEVLYNERTQSVIENPDQVVGIGTLFGFGGDPNNPTTTLYVKNDTFGTLYRIDWLDAAFCDAVEGLCPPEDDPPEEEEDFTQDDFWDDV